MAQQNWMGDIVVGDSEYLGFSDTPDTDAQVVKIVVGTGAPAAGAPAFTYPNGSMYLRKDAGTADLSLYLRIGAAWLPFKGV